MFAVIYLPQFSLQAALRHEPELWSKPVALVDPDERPAIICDLTEPARALGITPGLTPTQAMARCGSLLIRPRNWAQEQATRNALLDCAYGFSPHLEATSPGICTLDLRRLSTFFTGVPCDGNPGETTTALDSHPEPYHPTLTGHPALLKWMDWANKLQRALARSQLNARLGCGFAPGVARLAACWGNGLELVENTERFIAALPADALEPSPKTARILSHWGIRTVGEFLALGQDALIARLGLEAIALLAAASGTHLRPLRLVRPAEPFVESFEFEMEVESIEPLLFLLRRFVDQLTERCKSRGCVAQSLVLQLTLESGEAMVSQLHLPQPTAHPDILFRTLHAHLETVRSSSPIRSLSLQMIPCQPEQKQLGLFETVLSDPLQFRETLARLVAVLGSNRVGTPALENSHHPDAFRMAVPDFEKSSIVGTSIRQSFSIPIRRFRPPLKAEVKCGSDLKLSSPKDRTAVSVPRTVPVISPDPNRTAVPEVRSPGWARPISICCAVTKGNLKIMVGPWRASGNWWEQTAWEREEWDAVAADGQVIRLVRLPEGWFVEGVID